MIERPRLIPAVILGAMGLLALKLLAWTSAPFPGVIPASPPAFQSARPGPSGPEPQVWGLANVIARAHAPDILLDPETTGSVDKPKPKSPEDLQAEKAAKEGEELAAAPANKAGIINGTTQTVSPAERAILQRLSDRREEIEARLRELETRERLLDAAEKKLDGRVGDLKAQEAKGDGPQAKTAVEEAQAIKNLVVMYETMKPKDAARVFDRLNHDVLVPVVRQMSPRKMSDVLAAMSPVAAEKLTVALARSPRGPGGDRGGDAAPLAGAELQAIAPPR